MKNDIYVIMYCNECIATCNDLVLAIDMIEQFKKDNFYIQKEQFSIHIKISLNK